MLGVPASRSLKAENAGRAERRRSGRSRRLIGFAGGGSACSGGQTAGCHHRAAPGDPARSGGCRITARARTGAVAQQPPRRGRHQLRTGDRPRRRGRAAHYYLAVALDRQGLKDRAIAAYRRAVELAPELASAHNRLGELLEGGGDAEEAAQSYRRAAACAPDTPGGRVNLAKALMLEGDLREAEALLREAIALDPNSDPLHKVLGDVLATEGHFDEAIAAYDRAIGLNPSQAPAHLNAVYVGKCTEADRPRLARMLSSLRDASLRDEYRMHLHFACGKLLDDLGEYEEAMRHFEAATVSGAGKRFDRRYSRAIATGSRSVSLRLSLPPTGRLGWTTRPRY